MSWTELRHALKAPLATLELYLGLLEKGPPERRSHYLDVLHGEIDRLASMVEALGREGLEGSEE